MAISIDLNLMPFLPVSILVVLSLILKIKPDAEVHSIINHHLHVKIICQLPKVQIEHPKYFLHVLRLVRSNVFFQVGNYVNAFH